MKNMLKLEFMLLLLILMMSSCYIGPTSRVMKATNETYPATDPANVQSFLVNNPKNHTKR